jgi:hypothetical protein
MKARNALVEQIIDNGLDFNPIADILQGTSTERKLIWQYVFSSADLPLHIRRTLDQFGYPNLENTDARDSDQVIFKWAKIASDDVKKKLEDKRGVGVPCNTHLQTRPSIGENLIMDEDDYKVLMIDQLWCWIINEGESASCVFRFLGVNSVSISSAESLSKLRRVTKGIRIMPISRYLQ